MTDTLPIISADRKVQAAYEKMRGDGTSHAMAEMFALRQPPGTGGTDRAWMHGKMNGQELDHEPEPVRKRRMAIYKKLTGRNYPSGARYMKQLARFPGDPLAVVTDLGETKKRLIAGGHGCEDFGIKRAETPLPEKKPGLDEPIMQSFLRKERAKPENAKIKEAELREKIIDKHAHKVGKRR